MSTFRQLHESGCFVMPNPWDRGSAKLLAQLGFPALASSSAGFAFSLGLPDVVTALPRDRVLEHLRDLVAAVPLPINADFQNGYADDPDGVAANVKLCAATGVAGLSIEDATGDPRKPLYDPVLAKERVAAARAATDLVLTARSECHLTGHPDALAESIRRLTSFADAGADVLFAPGLRGRDAIRAVVEAVAPKPVNVLVGAHTGLTVADLAALGVRRVSVGSALARVAWTAFLRAARAIAEAGDFSQLQQLASTGELSDLFTS
jgi:2-methylisocitrate lyase-like PEP mutase family enzyme